jgi:hypothetical protein
MEATREVSFEAAKCSFLGFAFGFFALEVCACGWVVSGACDRASADDADAPAGVPEQYCRRRLRRWSETPGRPGFQQFADVVRGRLRLLLAGPESSAGRPMPDGRKPAPRVWNRIHFIVEDIASEVTRLRNAGVGFRNDIVTGPGGQQILLDDPSGNPIELFQPADR